MSDLHTRLKAVIEERLALAKAATPGPWEHVDHADPDGQPLTSDGRQSTYMGCGSVCTMGEHVMGGDIAAPNGDLYPRSGYSPFEDMAFIAAHDPADAIRRHEAALRSIEIHHPFPHRTGPRCVHCQDGTEPWPCGEFEIVAGAYGVNVEVPS